MPPVEEYEKMVLNGLIGSEFEITISKIVGNEKCVAARLEKNELSEYVQNENPHIAISTNKRNKTLLFEQIAFFI